MYGIWNIPKRKKKNQFPWYSVTRRFYCS